MSRTLISIPRGTSTYQILLNSLDYIERMTGYRPVDWLTDVYDEAYEEFIRSDPFDWDGFEMHMSCAADSFVEFIQSHYQHLNNDL